MISDQDFMKLIGSGIRARRLELKMSQTTLAKKVSIGRTSITNMELGTQPVGLARLFLIANALDCAAIDLLPDDQDVLDQEIFQPLPLAAPKGKWLSLRVFTRFIGVLGKHK